MKLEFDSVQDFIDFISFVFPETKEVDAKLIALKKELKDESTSLDNAIKTSEGGPNA